MSDLQEGDLVMIVRDQHEIDKNCERFIGEIGIIRSIHVPDPDYFEVDVLGHDILCFPSALKRIDDDGRQATTWDECVWSPHVTV